MTPEEFRKIIANAIPTPWKYNGRQRIEAEEGNFKCVILDDSGYWVDNVISMEHREARLIAESVNRAEAFVRAWKFVEESPCKCVYDDHEGSHVICERCKILADLSGEGHADITIPHIDLEGEKGGEE